MKKTKSFTPLEIFKYGHNKEHKRLKKIRNHKFLTGFTLVELLVVVVIVGLLSTIAVGSVSKARERARIAGNLEFSQGLFGGLGSHAVGIWNFDIVDGGITPDISGNGNNGTIFGNATQTIDTPYSIITSSVGRYALNFDGAGDYVQCADSDSLDPADSPFTIEVWFKWDGSPGKNTIYDKDGLYGARVFNGFFEYLWQPDSTWRGGTSFPVGENLWHHAVVLYDKTKQYLYKDGKLVFSRSQIGNIGTNNAGLLIGAEDVNGSNHYFSGKIDELRIYISALGVAEIEKHYAEGGGR